MATLRCPNLRNISRGFTILETLLATLVLTIGLLSLAALATQMLSGTARSHYSSVAADLASEKLEDLNRWPTFDPNVYAASGSTVGSLASDSSATVTSGGIGPELVNYYDDVDIADTTGSVSETISVVSGSTTAYKPTTHNPDGTISVATNSSSMVCATGMCADSSLATRQSQPPSAGGSPPR